MRVRHGTQAPFADGRGPRRRPRSRRTRSAACRSIRRRPSTRLSTPARPIISAPPAAAKSSSPTPRDSWLSQLSAAGAAHSPRIASVVVPSRHQRPRARSTPARCIPRCGRTIRELPHLRHGARAGNAGGSDRPERGASRHDPALLGRACAFHPRLRARDGRPSHRPPAVRAGRLSNWIQLALATPVALWAGWPFFERGWASLKSRNLNMFTLIAMGVGVAWAYSVVATVAPGLFPAAFRADHGSVAVYFEAAAVITTLVLLGPGAGAQSARADGRRDPRASRSYAEDRAARPWRWLGRGGRARRDQDRRSAARAAGREGSGGRRRSSRGEARSTNPC